MLHLPLKLRVGRTAESQLAVWNWEWSQIFPIPLLFLNLKGCSVD